MGKNDVRLCSHAMANGRICKSPALREDDFCYFHRSARERIKRQRRAARHKLPFQLPLLEDANSIQFAIGDTLNALISGQIDHKTAGLILYGLQTAASNVRHTVIAVWDSDRRYVVYQDEEETLEEEIEDEIAEEEEAAKEEEDEAAKADEAAASAAAPSQPAPANAPVVAPPDPVIPDVPLDPLPPKKRAGHEPNLPPGSKHKRA